MPAPNRIAIYVTGAAAFLGALSPVIADLDINSVAGIAAGLAAFAAVIYKWLDNWGKWERDEEQRAHESSPPDDFDEETAEAIPTTYVEASQQEPESADG